MLFSTTLNVAVCALVAAQGVMASKGNHWKSQDFNGHDNNSWKKEWGVSQWAYPQPHQKSGDNGNLNLVKNPTNSSGQVMQIAYPKGTWNPADSTEIGGVGFYASPLQVPSSASSVSLSYDAYFPNGFQFNKGGKLMGLYGGHSECSGGNNADSCWSTRFMWRQHGAGEVYAYIDKSSQKSNLCKEKGVVCNQQYGYSFGRGSFTWKTGQWNNVKQNIQLNSPGKSDGSLEIFFNGKQVFQISNLVFQSGDWSTIGIDFETFFGGSTSDWASPTNQYAYFNNFVMSYN
ncbi:hypothetical protein K450DRAFT_221449 [Umbelopsis ramanniana AG]|uniref:Polysaccharide lyase 14 domain-containing protein n=1 Tax=Umbelopsis ramanniana AG TaxID=1314678 RepID=A0AAD5HGG3_UMBRA|nr:uncharacterized protein K450DRAFT_221449 [Umbelopsis ramanniana AG]KAI8583487.1 hypothetical protein K450DRAFT_221449 [Umbelopsis ramanniana AG]